MTPEELARQELKAALEQEKAALAQLEAMPDVAATPTVAAPELSWFQRMQQMADMPPTSIGGVTPTEYAQSWTPSGIANQLRIIPEEGASIGGSIIGGSLGAALGGPVGAVAGGALGSYADVPIQAGIDYLLGTTPKQSRLAQATEEAGYGAAAETALRSLGAAGRLAVPVVRKVGSVLADYLGPQTPEAAQRLVGQELPSILVGQEAAQTAVGQAAAEQKLIDAATEQARLSQLGLQSSTLADLTQSPAVARTEALLSKQTAGNANVRFAEATERQIQEINEAAQSLVNIKDPNPKVAGQAARELLEKARNAENASASDAFTEEVRGLTAPIEGIAKSARSAFRAIFKDTKVLKPEGDVGDLYRKVRALEKAPEGAEAATTTTVGKLQDLRSRALELARAAEDGSRDELLAKKLVDILGEKIDNVKGTESLVEARNKWRQYKQRWFYDADGQRAPLNKLLRKQNPEDIIKDVSKKSAVSDEYAKVLDAREPIKLASEMAEFAKLKTVDEKLEWIEKKRAVYADSPIRDTVAEWESALKRIAGKKQAGKVAGLTAENIDVQAQSLVRALGGVGKETAASVGEAAAVSGIRNVARSNITKMLGAGGLGAALAAGLGGVGTAVSGALGIGGLWALEAARAARVGQSTRLTAQALTEALQNPTTALKYIEDARIYGAEEAQRRLATDQAVERRSQLLEALAPRAAAGIRGMAGESPALPTPPAATPPAATPEPVDEMEALNSREQALIDSMNMLKLQQPSATETPVAEVAAEPTSISIAIGKQDVSIPVGEGYAPPDLVKAVILAESGGDPEAVSEKGAAGLMQLMVGTARDLGLTSAERFVPNKNVKAGSRYLQRQIDKYGSIEAGLAAYNWGPANIATAISKLESDGLPVTWENIQKAVKVPSKTKAYVNTVLKYLEA
jgi:soluble lytic murein transglycosylase-like protein